MLDTSFLPFIGFFVGLIVGLTGVGGGALLAPALLLLFGLDLTSWPGRPGRRGSVIISLFHGGPGRRANPEWPIADY